LLKIEHPVFMSVIMGFRQEIHERRGERDAAQVYPESDSIAPWFCVRLHPVG
jgi:hypothetical protein